MRHRIVQTISSPYWCRGLVGRLLFPHGLVVTPYMPLAFRLRAWLGSVLSDKQSSTDFTRFDNGYSLSCEAQRQPLVRPVAVVVERRGNCESAVFLEVVALLHDALQKCIAV